MTRTTALMERLDGLLDAQAAAIRTGDLTALAGLAAAAEALAGEEWSGGEAGVEPPPEALARLRARAGVVLEQMTYLLRGVRDARRRVDSILGLSSTLETYDQSGKSRVIGGATRQVERRV